jgi:hypothetical protein
MGNCQSANAATRERRHAAQKRQSKQKAESPKAKVSPKNTASEKKKDATKAKNEAKKCPVDHSKPSSASSTPPSSDGETATEKRPNKKKAQRK